MGPFHLIWPLDGQIATLIVKMCSNWRLLDVIFLKMEPIEQLDGHRMLFFKKERTCAGSDCFSLRKNVVADLSGH